MFSNKPRNMMTGAINQTGDCDEGLEDWECALGGMAGGGGKRSQ